MPAKPVTLALCEIMPRMPLGKKARERGALLDQLITVASKLKDVETFERLAIFTFSHPSTGGMEDQLVMAILSAEQLKATWAIRSFANYTFSKPHTREMGHALALLLFVAVDLKDIRTLEILQNDVLPHHRSLDMKYASPLLANFLQGERQNGDWKILKEASRTLLEGAIQRRLKGRTNCFQLIKDLLTGKG